MCLTNRFALLTTPSSSWRSLSWEFCRVRALCYYRGFMKDCLELRKERQRLIILNNDNNSGKELGTATISLPLWSLVQLSMSRCPIKTVKVHEACAVSVTASLQLFSKVDLQTVIKTDR